MTTVQDANRIAKDFKLNRAQVAKLMIHLKTTRLLVPNLTQRRTVEYYSDLVSALDAVIDVLPSEKPQNDEDYYYGCCYC